MGVAHQAMAFVLFAASIYHYYIYQSTSETIPVNHI
jgi:hypothetical protein